MSQPIASRFIVVLASVVVCGAPLRGDVVHPTPTLSSAQGKSGKDVMIRITTADKGGKQDFRVGDVFEVQLPENPSTGYRWRLRSPLSPALEIKDDFFAPSSSGMVGAGGLRSWRFRAQKEGVALLSIDNRRSWEPEPVETFEVTIEVKAP